MDITVKVHLGDGDWKSSTFIGDKEKILPEIQKYIKEHETFEIDVISNDGSTDLHNDELFNQ